MAAAREVVSDYCDDSGVGVGVDVDLRRLRRRAEKETIVVDVVVVVGIAVVVILPARSPPHELCCCHQNTSDSEPSRRPQRILSEICCCRKSH